MRAHAEDDPEIVLIDTDGLTTWPRYSKRRSGGWWPAGLLLSRTLVEMHRDKGEASGWSRPTRPGRATLDALRDVEPGDTPLADVGTAHRFQGREFPVVVFDPWRPSSAAPGWIAQATLAGGNNFKREGVRLFNVAATRVKRRLYVIASRQRVLAAGAAPPSGTSARCCATGVRPVLGTNLITPPTWDPVALGPESTALAEVLARHIEVTDIHDEKTFYEQLPPDRPGGAVDLALVALGREPRPPLLPRLETRSAGASRSRSSPATRATRPREARTRPRPSGPYVPSAPVSSK